MAPLELVAQMIQHLVDKDLGAAEAAFRSAAVELGAEHDPARCRSAADACYDLGIDLRGAGRLDAAEEAHRHALRLAELGGDQARAAACSNHLGILYLETGRLELARQSFTDALQRRDHLDREGDPRNAIFVAGTICNLGNVSRAIGELERARAHYRDAISRLQPAAEGASPDPIAQHFLSNARGGLQSLEGLAEAEEPIGSSATVLVGLHDPMPARSDEELRSAQGDPDAALSRAEQLLAADPSSWRARRMRALALAGFLEGEEPRQRHLDLDRHLGAVVLLDEAIQHAPDDFDCRLFKARVLRQLAHALQASYRARHGVLHERLGEEGARRRLAPLVDLFFCCFARACESYEQALRIAPDEAWLWQELGCALIELMSGHEDEARHAFERALELDPTLPRAREELAALEVDPGHGDLN